MVKRDIIIIDEDKCDGCGLCVPNCPEGAIQIIDGKARLVSDLFCDGLGECINHCPRDAITIEKREADKYNERKTMENIIKMGPNTIKAHLEHLKAHGEIKNLEIALEVLREKKLPNPLYENEKLKILLGGYPGSRVTVFKDKKERSMNDSDKKMDSELSQWPIQFHLVPISAPFFENSDLLIAADCVPFASANFHSNILKGKSLIMGCPKLDDAETYTEKLTEIIKSNNLKSITVANMEVPCCFGLQKIIEISIKNSGKIIPFKQIIVGIDGEIKL